MVHRTWAALTATVFLLPVEASAWTKLAYNECERPVVGSLVQPGNTGTAGITHCLMNDYFIQADPPSLHLNKTDGIPCAAAYLNSFMHATFSRVRLFDGKHTFELTPQDGDNHSLSSILQEHNGILRLRHARGNNEVVGYMLLLGDESQSGTWPCLYPSMTADSCWSYYSGDNGEGSTAFRVVSTALCDITCLDGSAISECVQASSDCYGTNQLASHGTFVLRRQVSGNRWELSTGWGAIRNRGSWSVEILLTEEATETTITTETAQRKKTLQDFQACAWTLEYPCPGQPWTDGVSESYARDDGSLGYIRCCTEGLWEKAQCKNNFQDFQACAWTVKFPFPHQPWTHGVSKDYAKNDGSLGHMCCCTGALWKVGSFDCWTPCGAKGGYCSLCNSASGESGACCRPGYEDPSECKYTQNLQPGFHSCGIVRATTSTTAVCQTFCNAEADAAVAVFQLPLLVMAAVNTLHVQQQR